MQTAALMLLMMVTGSVQAAILKAPVQLALRPHLQAIEADWSLAEAVEASETFAPPLHLDELRLPAPSPGHIDRWSRAQIEHVLRARADHVLPEFCWTGADHLTVTRKVQKVAVETLFNAAVAAWSETRPDLKVAAIELSRPLQPIDIGVGNYRLRPRHIAQANQSEVVVWLDVLMHERVVRSVSIPLRSLALRIAYTANRFLAAGEIVTPADFSKVETTGTSSAEYSVLLDAPHSVRLRRAVRQGEVLTKAALEPSEAVRRGDPVRIVTRAGTMTLEANGTAADDALPGQIVAVHWGAGRELVRGRLFDGHRVEIE